MDIITPRQQEILTFLKQHFRREKFWPSIREIQDHFGFRSTNAVMGHLKALERKKYISRNVGQARTFKVNFDGKDARLVKGPEVLNIPIFGSITAGYPDRVEPGGAIGRMQIDVETAGVRKSRKTFALKVRGDSMIDAGIYDGDMVIIEQGLPNNGDIVAALIDGETTLKRFIKKGRKAPFLQAANEDYPDLYPVADLIIQGLAKAVVRHLWTIRFKAPMCNFQLTRTGVGMLTWHLQYLELLPSGVLR